MASRSGSRLRFFPVAGLHPVGSRRASCFVGRASRTGFRQSLPQGFGCPVWQPSRPFWQCLRSRARLPVGAASFAHLATISGVAFGHPATSGPRQASLHFSSPSTSVTVQMQQVVASFTGSAMPRASRLARSLPSCAGWCTCVAPNPLVKGTSCACAQAAPYRER